LTGDASGHTAAPPSSLMKERRFMSSTGTFSPMRYQPTDRSVRSFPHNPTCRRRVNKPENDDPSIIEPIEPATDAA
jgi:hypothetical protein